MHIERSRRFDKDFSKQPKKIQARFYERIGLFATDQNHPLLRVHALAGDLLGCYSFNITADVRVIFEYHASDTVRLLAIGTHAQLYE